MQQRTSKTGNKPTKQAGRATRKTAKKPADNNAAGSTGPRQSKRLKLAHASGRDGDIRHWAKPHQEGGGLDVEATPSSIPVFTSGLGATPSLIPMSGSGVEATPSSMTVFTSGLGATPSSIPMSGSGVKATPSSMTVFTSGLGATLSSIPMSGSGVEATLPSMPVSTSDIGPTTSTMPVSAFLDEIPETDQGFTTDEDPSRWDLDQVAPLYQVRPAENVSSENAVSDYEDALSDGEAHADEDAVSNKEANSEDECLSDGEADSEGEADSKEEADSDAEANPDHEADSGEAGSDRETDSEDEDLGSDEEALLEEYSDEEYDPDGDALLEEFSDAEYDDGNDADPHISCLDTEYADTSDASTEGSKSAATQVLRITLQLLKDEAESMDPESTEPNPVMLKRFARFFRENTVDALVNRLSTGITPALNLLFAKDKWELDDLLALPLAENKKERGIYVIIASRGETLVGGYSGRANGERGLSQRVMQHKRMVRNDKSHFQELMVHTFLRQPEVNAAYRTVFHFYGTMDAMDMAVAESLGTIWFATYAEPVKPGRMYNKESFRMCRAIRSSLLAQGLLPAAPQWQGLNKAWQLLQDADSAGKWDKSSRACANPACKRTEEDGIKMWRIGRSEWPEELAANHMCVPCFRQMAKHGHFGHQRRRFKFKDVKPQDFICADCKTTTAASWYHAKGDGFWCHNCYRRALAHRNDSEGRTCAECEATTSSRWLNHPNGGFWCVRCYRRARKDKQDSEGRICAECSATTSFRWHGNPGGGFICTRCYERARNVCANTACTSPDCKHFRVKPVEWTEFDGTHLCLNCFRRVKRAKKCEQEARLNEHCVCANTACISLDCKQFRVKPVGWTEFNGILLCVNCFNQVQYIKKYKWEARLNEHYIYANTACISLDCKHFRVKLVE